MHYIDHDTAEFGSGKRQFTDTILARYASATLLPATWLNDVQNNIMKVCEAGGLGTTKGESSDLLNAITTLITKEVSPVSSIIDSIIGDWQGLVARSTTPITIGLTVSNFDVGDGKLFVEGLTAFAVSSDNSENFVSGPIVSYTGGILTVDVSTASGSGVVSDWIVTVIGPRGTDGTDGVAGLPGTDGEDGADGLPGAKGDQGVTGAQGDQGDQGDTGGTGSVGPTVLVNDTWQATPDGVDRLYFSDNSHTYIKSNGETRIRNSTDTEIARFLDDGTLLTTGNVSGYSDRRLKSDIEVITNALDKLSKLHGKMFTMNGRRSTGLIAQDVLKVLPEAVGKDENGMLYLAYGNLAGLFVESTKELKELVRDLVQRLEVLEHGTTI
ncbi:MAG: hypothetical protein COA62_15620 [Rhodobiaceae bacterium]|nr:MAG: hypothetical protein COA62_15620 [Rhodobiaceae bacterium]